MTLIYFHAVHVCPVKTHTPNTSPDRFSHFHKHLLETGQLHLRELKSKLKSNVMLRRSIGQ